MAKVNKKSFHCILLVHFTHNSHSILSSKLTKMKFWWNQFLKCVFHAPSKFLNRMSSNWEALFIKQEISEGLRFVPTSPFFLVHLFISSVFPSDVPGGFGVNQQEEPIEGGDLRLTCVANKYLYTMLSWQRVYDTEDAQSWSPAPSDQQLISGEFSNSLVLLLSNLTARDSGAYRCSARHLVTRQEIHLDTQVVVTSE